MEMERPPLKTSSSETPASSAAASAKGLKAGLPMSLGGQVELGRRVGGVVEVPPPNDGSHVAGARLEGHQRGPGSIGRQH